jgi:hypothetical protein
MVIGWDSNPTPRGSTLALKRRCQYRRSRTNDGTFNAYGNASGNDLWFALRPQLADPADNAGQTICIRSMTVHDSQTAAGLYPRNGCLFGGTSM